MEKLDLSSAEQPSAAELLASEIKRLRAAAKLSQQDLAQQSGYTREYISMAERRDTNIPSHEVVQALDTTLKADGYLIELRARAKAEQEALRNSLQGSPDPDSDRPADRRALLGFEIRKARQKYGLSQPQLAKAVGYSRQYISSAENPQHPLPSAELVQAIDRHLNADNTLVELRKTAHFHAYTARHGLTETTNASESITPQESERVATAGIMARHDKGASRHETHTQKRYAEPNVKFRTARESTPSPTTPGYSMSRAELAEAVNEYVWHTTQKRYTALDPQAIGRYERGEIQWPTAVYRTAFRTVLGAQTDSDLGFYPIVREGSTARARIDTPSKPPSEEIQHTESVPSNAPSTVPTSRPSMAQQHEEHERPVVTASLTTGVVRVTHGMQESARLSDEVLTLDHVDWETTLYIGDVEYHSTEHGPYPNHQLRISVRPSTGFAALNYTDHDDPEMPVANSYNPTNPPPAVDLIFSGATGKVFPRAAAIPISEAHAALHEWLRTWKRPTCIEWQPYDVY